MVFQPIDHIGKAVYNTLCPCHHILIGYFGVVARRHKTCDVGAKCPNTKAVLDSGVVQSLLLSCSFCDTLGCKTAGLRSPCVYAWGVVTILLTSYSLSQIAYASLNENKL